MRSNPVVLKRRRDKAEAAPAPRAAHPGAAGRSPGAPTRQKQHRNPTRQEDRRAEDARDHLRRMTPRPGGCSSSGPRWKQRAPAPPLLPLPRRRCRSPRPPFIDDPPPPTDRRRRLLLASRRLCCCGCAPPDPRARRVNMLGLGLAPSLACAAGIGIRWPCAAAESGAGRGESEAKRPMRCLQFSTQGARNPSTRRAKTLPVGYAG